MSHTIDLTVIPKGHYCYTHDPDRPVEHNCLPIRVCPYWRRIDDTMVRCDYLEETSEQYSFDSLLWDQVKECGLNVNTYYSPHKLTSTIAKNMEKAVLIAENNRAVLLRLPSMEPIAAGTPEAVTAAGRLIFPDGIPFNKDTDMTDDILNYKLR